MLKVPEPSEVLTLAALCTQLLFRTLWGRSPATAAAALTAGARAEAAQPHGAWAFGPRHLLAPVSFLPAVQQSLPSSSVKTGLQHRADPWGAVSGALLLGGHLKPLT